MDACRMFPMRWSGKSSSFMKLDNVDAQKLCMSRDVEIGTRMPEATKQESIRMVMADLIRRLGPPSIVRL